MTDARYQELLSQLLESTLSETDAGELRLGLEDEPQRMRDLREHLVLWELWAQEQSDHRSAEAFNRGFQMRLHAEMEGQVSLTTPSDVPLRRRHRRRVALSFAAGVLLLMTAVAVFWQRSPRRIEVATSGPVGAPIAGSPRGPAPSPEPQGPHAKSPAARLVSLHGEGVCARCILHMTDACQLTIRVREGEREELFLVDADPVSRDLVPACCAKPIPIFAQGEAHTENGRTFLATTRLEVRP
jgi:hypothetical protein